MILLTDGEVQEIAKRVIGDPVVDWEPEYTLAIRKAQLKKVYEWGDGECPHGTQDIRRRCSKCWQTLLEEIK